MICLNTAYSTTRQVTSQKPVVEVRPDDKFEVMLFLPEGNGRQGEGGLRTQGYFKASQPDKPIITVITVVFNGEKFLETAIQSVINQTYDNVEYIIIDGGSTDGTLDIIRKYEHAIDYWASEDDRGIYDAMNKGVVLCTGNIIAFLNSDDWYKSNILSYVCNNMDRDYLACAVDKIYRDNVSKSFYPININEVNYKRSGNPFPHQGLFVQLYTFKELGLFDLKYKIAADMDFIYRMLDSQFEGRVSNTVAANFRDGGASSKIGVIVESRAIEYDYGASILSVVFSFTWRIIVVLSRRLFIYLKT